MGSGRLYYCLLGFTLGIMAAILSLVMFCWRLGSWVWSAFRCTIQRACSLRLLWQGGFVLAGVAWSFLMLYGEWAYASGVKQRRFDRVLIAAEIFPFERMIREGPAHVVMISRAPAQIAIPILELAIHANPYSADILWALTQYKAEMGDQSGAMNAFYRFRALVNTEILARTVLSHVQTN